MYGRLVPSIMPCSWWCSILVYVLAPKRVSDSFICRRVSTVMVSVPGLEYFAPSCINGDGLRAGARVLRGHFNFREIQVHFKTGWKYNREMFFYRFLLVCSKKTFTFSMLQNIKHVKCRYKTFESHSMVRWTRRFNTVRLTLTTWPRANWHGCFSTQYLLLKPVFIWS